MSDAIDRRQVERRVELSRLGLDVHGKAEDRRTLVARLKHGVEGTSMPSFGLLPEEELNKLVSYVIHLSLRGQLEYQLMRELFTDVFGK